jgi:outer membrane immunogenic protein
MTNRCITFCRTTLGRALAVAALLALPVAAQAADLPMRPSYKAPPMMPAYFSWTGFYVGINGGYGFGTSRHSAGSRSYDVSGPVVGGTLGYNWQMSSIVFGVEGDFDWSDIHGGTPCPNPAFNCRTANNWMATARGRLGYAFDRWLPYFTGGVAFGNIKATVTPGFPGVDQTNIGYTLGGGLEYAMWDRWSVKAEYLWVDLGNVACNARCGAAIDKVNFSANVIRAGVNYRF